MHDMVTALHAAPAPETQRNVFEKGLEGAAEEGSIPATDGYKLGGTRRRRTPMWDDLHLVEGAAGSS